jgi:hypothetical protein
VEKNKWIEYVAGWQEGAGWLAKKVDRIRGWLAREAYVQEE